MLTKLKVNFKSSPVIVTLLSPGNCEIIVKEKELIDMILG